MQTDLFMDAQPLSELKGTPLPERLRPQSLEQILGQEKVLKSLRAYLKGGSIPNLILWGPPGSGKTTLALNLSKQLDFYFLAVNAVDSGARELKDIGSQAQHRRRQFGKQTLLFVDEIHRFNKSQQDVLLPLIENGDLILVGATTENPSYELNRALLSRCRLLVLERLDEKSLQLVVSRAVKEQLNLPVEDIFSKEALENLIHLADGDARRVLSLLEEVFSWKAGALSVSFPLSSEDLRGNLGQRALGYDKKSDQHYDMISAMIKSIRGSDADAGIYYLARMLKSGEDPLFLARRLVILASEDIGNADPRALQVAVSGLQALELVGLPEGAINLAQVVCYLATAPKSNRSYMALKNAQALVEETGSLPVPLHLRSSKTTEMKNLGYGKGYQYAHDFERGWVEQDFLPQDLTKNGKTPELYTPSEHGYEKRISEFVRWLKQK